MCKYELTIYENPLWVILYSTQNIRWEFSIYIPNSISYVIYCFTRKGVGVLLRGDVRGSVGEGWGGVGDEVRMLGEDSLLGVLGVG